MTIFSAEMAPFKNTQPGQEHYQVIQRAPDSTPYTHAAAYVYADGSWRYTDHNFLYTSKQAAYKAVRKLNAALKDVEECITRDGAIIL